VQWSRRKCPNRIPTEKGEWVRFRNYVESELMRHK
jgi:hypothetical protein